MADEHNPNGAYSEVFDDADARPAQTVHRIRANSSIMRLKKILGTSFIAALNPVTQPALPPSSSSWMLTLTFAPLQWPTEGRFVSTLHPHRYGIWF
jgi:hypothetical protein